MTVEVADMDAHVQRLVSIAKLKTVLEVHTTEEQYSVVHFFCRQKDSVQWIFIKKCFLFMVGSVCHVKQLTTGLRNSLKDISKVADVA
jgi:hypothetical protein